LAAYELDAIHNSLRLYYQLHKYRYCSILLDTFHGTVNVYLKYYDKDLNRILFRNVLRFLCGSDIPRVYAPNLMKGRILNYNVVY